MTAHPFNFLTSEQVVFFNESSAHYFKDWTNQFEVGGQGVLFPKNTEEVQKIIQTCNKNKLSLVPSGGRTGLSGGAVAQKNDWVISLEKMNKIIKISEVDFSVIAQAGVITEVLQEEVLKKGLYFPVNFSATGSSHIGGNIATNAGGVHVVKYGNTRSWVKALTVVTGNGDILELNNGLIKNNTGYDLMQLFIASEGTLGVITEVEMGLTTPPSNKQVILLGLENLNTLLDSFSYSKKNLPLLAFELFDNKALNKVTKTHNLPNPIESDCAYYVLIEVEISKSFTEDDLALKLEKFFENEWAIDGTISTNSTQYENLWKYRELISETLSPETPYKNDVSVKISKIPSFIDTIYNTVLKNTLTLKLLFLVILAMETYM